MVHRKIGNTDMLKLIRSVVGSRELSLPSGTQQHNPLVRPAHPLRGPFSHLAQVVGHEPRARATSWIRCLQQWMRQPTPAPRELVVSKKILLPLVRHIHEPEASDFALSTGRCDHINDAVGVRVSE